ncbi:TdeIII family type II restriction endonuclease [Helicobacter suis]|uniref:TdeIII family type II restriction endonuclease n=1 Tax=Helicobacter suis TaxID=104628 RepID=UPI0035A246F3
MKRKIKQDVKDLLIKALKSKPKSYNPETSYMPFHTRLLGSDRMALFSFIQSLNTNFWY